jgi:hypothetical protein
MLTPRRLMRTLAGALMIAAVAAPGASARPIDMPAVDRDAVPHPVRPTVTRTIDEGVDLGSAALGAGGATAVLMLTAAAVLLRPRAPRRHATGGS